MAKIEATNKLGVKPTLPLILSIISLIIAFLALVSSFLTYRETFAVKYKWEAYSRGDIPIKLFQRTTTSGKNCTIIEKLIPIWIECRISNTGMRTFSIDSIFASYKEKEKTQTPINLFCLDYNLFKDFELPTVKPKEKLTVPIAIEPGHSKKFFTKIDVILPDKLRQAYTELFKDKEFITLGDIFLLSDTTLSIGRYIDIKIQLNFSGGNFSVKRVDLG